MSTQQQDTSPKAGQAQTASTLSESVLEKPTKPALGSPHDAYAAVLLTLSLAGMFFTLSVGRANESFWWLLVSAGVMIPLLTSFHYYLRAHGAATKGTGASIPRVTLYFAVMSFVLFILPALAQGVPSTGFLAFSCVVIATLIIAPVQLVLSKDPNRDSELTA